MPVPGEVRCICFCTSWLSAGWQMALRQELRPVRVQLKKKRELFPSGADFTQLVVEIVENEGWPTIVHIETDRFSGFQTDRSLRLGFGRLFVCGR